MELFAVRDLTFFYPEQESEVLKNININISSGEFVVIAGPSGCGKSTLLRQFKTILTPHGNIAGGVFYRGKLLETVTDKEQASGIGFVVQDPDSQIVTDKVWHELAFGLESLGYKTAEIRTRVAEMASFFGIQTWFHKEVTSLSGGQKQLLNLASVMVMQPDILILDEPTSQLDPIAATDFLQTLGRINRELGTTIVMTEHRLDEVIPLSDRLIVMDKGEIIADDTPQKSFELIGQKKHKMMLSMPTPMRIWSSIGGDFACPLTISEGKSFLTEWSQNNKVYKLPQKDEKTFETSPCINLEDVWFRYDKNGADIVKGLSFKAYYGQLFCILGGNGTGKTTTMSLINGNNKPYRGKITKDDVKIVSLPQNPQMILVKKNVREELFSVFDKRDYEQVKKEVGVMVALCKLNGLLDRHPYDLSGGEQQRVALAKILLQNPDIILMDEPTKGLDGEFKTIFASILEKLKKQGKCIVMVSHDVDFCATYADRCGLFFDGSIVSEDAPGPFFSGKNFYTTAANRMARHIIPDAVTVEDVIRACKGYVVEEKTDVVDETSHDTAIEDITLPAGRKPQNIPLWRKVMGAISGTAMIVLLVITSVKTDLSQLYTNDNFIKENLGTYVMLFVCLILFAVCTGKKASAHEVKFNKGKLSKRTKLCVALSLIAIPLTIVAGTAFLGGRKYMIISLLIIFETMVPFFLMFEGRKPQARELVILAVLSALAVGGRMAFFALPGFKPVAAMVIISGVAFGGEAGFMVGAITMLCSNIVFGQGPWTPWQMFAMGVIGLLSGIVLKKGVLHRDKIAITVFGVLATFIIYGGVMNPASVIMYQSNVNIEMIIAAYMTGVPADVVHTVSTGVFLWLLSDPMLEKLDRVKVKYGLLEK